MKALWSVLLFWSCAWSGPYDPFLIETQLLLLPKIACLEKTIGSTPQHIPMSILIVYDEGDRGLAETLAKNVSKKSAPSGRRIVVKAVSVREIDNINGVHALYAMRMAPEQLRKLRNLTISAKVLSTLYDHERLKEEGFIFSVRMERSPVILINTNALRNSSFSFPDSLLNIARMID